MERNMILNLPFQIRNEGCGSLQEPDSDLLVNKNKHIIQISIKTSKKDLPISLSVTR